jgi:hypothetical protein
LNRRCGNPMGRAGGLTDWRVDGVSSIFNYSGGTRSGGALGHNVTAQPGDRFGFFYRARNNGPTETHRRVYFYRTYTYPDSSRSNENFSSIAAGWNPGITGWRGAGNTGTITQSDVGSSFTMSIRAAWATESGGSYNFPTMRVNVPYNYNLTPQPVSRSSTSADQGEDITFSNFRIQNSGPTKSHNRTWRVLKIVMDPGASTTFSQPINLAPGLAYCSGLIATYNGINDCSTLETDAQVFNPGTTQVGPASTTVNTADEPPGSNICVTVAVYGPDTGTNFWRMSRPSCIVVGKRPLTHIIGGDVWAGGNFPDSSGICTTTRANVHGTSRSQFNAGSWGEYGIFALGDITDFGTAAVPFNAASPSSSQKLAFSNTAPIGNYFGNTLQDHCFTDVFSDFSGSDNSSSTSFDIDSLNGGGATIIVRTSAQNVTINGGSAAVGKTIVVYATHANANVTINGDINYSTGSFNGIDRIPRVFILSNNNITIHGNAENINAWLAAKGTLSTCHVTGNLTIDLCDDQLLINGPVSAGTLDLRRTFGADGTTNAQRQRPGEIFNLRPDYYLSAYSASLQNVTPRTVFQQELPPRF